jgi:GrpB-like predicted nucleotidyltransferase (UPF0157 family)/8-oxo-dGTP pyrophosphatase MutT (NUDIX family)
VISIVHESKVIAVIFRKDITGFSLLVYKAQTSPNMGYRFPGGGINPQENEIDALYREIEEETGLSKDKMTYFRKIGSLEYFKPGIGKMVKRHDFLLMINEQGPNEFSFSVTSNDKDNETIFDFEWIPLSRYPEIDKELSQFINIYNTPELYIDPDDFGIKGGKLEFRGHNVQWSRIYEFQEIEIRSVLECTFIIDHIGSTAIADLIAKPIIDILIGVQDNNHIDDIEQRLTAIGYICRGENGIPGRQYFIKESDGIVFFHVHVYSIANGRYSDHIKTKEVLTLDSNLRYKYELYKIACISKTRKEYADGKDQIIKEILSNK